MKKLVYITICLFSIVGLNAQVPTFQWAKQIGDNANIYEYSLTVDQLGNIYTTGYFIGTIDFDPGISTSVLTVTNASIFITKMDANGNFVWAKKISGSSYLYGYSVAVDASGNVYTTGLFDGIADFDPGAGIFNITSIGFSDIFITKLDASGNFIWAKNMGGNSGTSNAQARSISFDGNGNICLVGHFEGTIDFDPNASVVNLISTTGKYNVFVLKLMPSGNLMWVKNIGGTSDNHGYYNNIDSLGDIYTTGYFNGITDFDPGITTYSLSTTGNNDIFISKLNPLGNFLWAIQIGGTGDDRAFKSQIDGFGNLYTTGYFTGTVDFDPGPGIFNLTSSSFQSTFILKLDSDGNFVWAKNIKGVSNITVNSIAVNSLGYINTIGSFSGIADCDPNAGIVNLTSLGINDVYVSRIDPSGNLIWATSFGGTSSDIGSFIGLDPLNNIYTIGSFQGTPDFDFGTGTTTLTSVGADDIFIHKMSQPSVGLKENDLKNNINIYPNPTSNIINIEASTSSATDKLKIEISNVIGQVLISENQTNQRSSFNIQNFPSGLYFIKLISEDNVIETRKIIKE